MVSRMLEVHAALRLSWQHGARLRARHARDDALTPAQRKRPSCNERSATTRRSTTRSRLRSRSTRSDVKSPRCVGPAVTLRARC
jgi:hypothetical protein